MTNIELYKYIIKHLAERMRNDGLLDQDDLDELEIDEDNVSILMEKGCKLDWIINKIKSDLEDVEESELQDINWNVYVKNIELQQNISHCDFVYKGSESFVTNSVTINNAINRSALENDDLWNFLWRLSYLQCKTNVSNHLETFFDYCINVREGEFMILTCYDEEQAWRLYSFAILDHVNRYRINLPIELEQQAKAYQQNVLVYNSAIPYEQYFDIYNVMSESHFATDILARFLRMYQVLEHMAYRVELAKIANDTHQSGFVRNVLSKSSEAVKSESVIFNRSMKAIFPAVDWTGRANLADYRSSFEEIYGTKKIDPWNWKINTLSQIIYAFRNSIVHNKESELHFSLSNKSEYEKVIPIIKELINEFEPRIIDKIQDAANDNPIRYNVDSIPLY